MFYLCDSEATATICFICTIAKRQQQHEVGYEELLQDLAPTPWLIRDANPQKIAQPSLQTIAKKPWLKCIYHFNHSFI